MNKQETEITDTTSRRLANHLIKSCGKMDGAMLAKLTQLDRVRIGRIRYKQEQKEALARTAVACKALLRTRNGRAGVSKVEELDEMRQQYADAGRSSAEALKQAFCNPEMNNL